MKSLNVFKTLACSCVILPTLSNAVELKADNWTVNINGNINGFFTYVSCDDDGAMVSGNPLLCTGEDATSVSNGYLPTALDVSVATSAGGYNIEAHVVYEGGTVSNAAFNNGSSQEAFRAYMKVSNDSMGTVMIGKDFGIFAMESVFNDMSVTGVGAHAVVSSPLNTTLGSVGYGYPFDDRLSMINYTFPTNGNFSATVGMYQPLDLVSLGAGHTTSGDSGSELPGFHGKLKYSFDSGFIASSFINQSVNTGKVDDNAFGFDVAASVTFAEKLTLFGSYTLGEGIGNTGLFFDAYDLDGEARETNSFFVQAVYDFDGTRLGVNYGLTDIDRNKNDPVTNVESNSKITLGLYHDLFAGFIISSEVSMYESENFAGGTIENTGFSIGALFFF